MDNRHSRLPLYQSHKQVRGGKIVDIKHFGPSSSSILTLHNGAQRRVSSEYVEKHDPQIGGYYVLYEDGYESWSPAEAFENGHTQISET